MSLNTILATAPLTATGYHLKATGTTLGQSLIWDNGTNVGIGNTNTSYTLDVTGSGRFTTTLLVSGAATFGSTINMTGTNAQILQTTSNSVAGNYVGTFYNSNANSYGLYIAGGNSSSNNALYITDSTRTNTLFTVLGDGKVGIGNLAPSYTLDVSGTLRNTTSAYFATTSGSVGIGTITPTSYFYSGNGLAIYNASQNTLSIATDTSGTSSLFFSNGASGAARYNGYLEYIHSTNSMTFGTGGFTRLTLASTGAATFSGNALTVSGPNPAITATTSDTTLYSYIALTGGTSSNYIYTLSNSYATTGPYIAGALTLVGSTSGGISLSAGHASGEVRLYSGGGNERMRITSGGYTKISNNGSYVNLTGNYHEIYSNRTNDNIVYFTNAAASPYGPYITFPNASPNNGTNYFLACVDSANSRAIINSNGGLTNYSANNTNLSDERTKKEITPLESYWNKFKAIEIVKFKYKDQTHDDFNIGVIAQQVESIAPEFIDVDGFGETPKDGVPFKTVYTSDLHHATIKVLQEAMVKIEEQQAQIQSLQEQINILAK